MKQRIEINFTEKELDSFLKKKYGYAVWDFEYFFVNLFLLYYFKEPVKVHQFIEKRINRLKNIKRRIIELLDDFLIEINFYKFYKLISGENNIWTPQNKENFIIKKFELCTFFSVIDSAIQIIKELDSRWYNGKELLLNIKPKTLVILTLSYVMQTGKKVDWINMKNLINWFSIKFDEIGILDFFGMEKCKAPSADILRFTRNKYKNTKYNIYAKYLFAYTLATAKEYERDEIPRPLNELYERLKISKNFEETKKFLDFWLGVNLTIK